MDWKTPYYMSVHSFSPLFFLTFLVFSLYLHWLPRWYSGKESTCQSRRHKRHGFHLWVEKIPWSRKWQPAPVFLPGKFHGQRNLVGYSPWGCSVLDTIEYWAHSARIGLEPWGPVHLWRYLIWGQAREDGSLDFVVWPVLFSMKGQWKK